MFWSTSEIKEGIKELEIGTNVWANVWADHHPIIIKWAEAKKKEQDGP